MNRYNIGDEVRIDFLNSKVLKNSCYIDAVKQTSDGVLYDVRVPIGYDRRTKILKDIESELIADPIH